MKRQMIAALCVGLGAAAALAQSFNVDINATSSWGAGVPANSYGAAAGQPGTWNDINASTPTTSTLKNLDGTNSAVTFTRSLEGTIQSFFDSNTSAEWDKLCADAQRSTTLDMNFSFNNLQAGTYAVFSYGVTAGSTNLSAIQVAGSTSNQTQYIGADPMNDALLLRNTFGVHIITVAAGGSIPIKVVGSGTLGWGTLGGIQLKKIGNSRLRFYVDDSANAAIANGTAWDHAYTDLQTPLAYAPIIGASKVEIWVAQGFYEPTTNTDRSISFVIPSSLLLYGGFAGTETSVTPRYPSVHPTYLSGNIGASGNTDDSYHVVVADDTTASTLLDGFYIVRGNASGDDSRGGGMHIDNGDIEVRNCSFSTNKSSLDGAAVYCHNASPSFSDCIFYNNDASNGSGGAAYVSSSGTPWFVNCRFLGNSAVGDGGAVEVLFADAVFVNSVFSGNTASFGNGGAIYHAGIAGDDATIVNCTISMNAAPNDTCGGLFLNKGVGSGAATASVRNCILWGNTAGFAGTVAEAQRGAINGTTITTDHTTIQGLSSDPKFVSAAGADGVPGNFDDNLRLQSNSPCIDAGDNGGVMLDGTDLDNDGVIFETTPLDLDRHLRRYNVPSVVDTGAGTAPIVDRGAYELALSKGDMNCDGVVDFKDIDPFVTSLGGQTAYLTQFPNCTWLNGDSNCDGTVDFKDIDPFVSCLSGNCNCTY